MLPKLSPLLAVWIWVLGIVMGTASAQEENDFDNNPAYRKLPANSYSLTPPYLDSQMGSRWFDFGGDTIVRVDSYVRLASDRPSQRGWLFSRVPLAATNWQVEVEFRLSGDGYLRGDGFAMWLTKERGQLGPVFGSVDKFDGLGIFFDTYKNGRPSTTFPYVMAMKGDGQTPYDDVKDGKDNEIAGCSARGIRGTESPVKARITYFQDQYLALDLQYKPGEAWKKCFNVDAAQNNIKIPSTAYLGFSAATGELSDNHDIISVHTSSLYPNMQHGSQRPLQTRAGSRSTLEGEGASGGVGYMVKFLLLVAVVAGCYYGYSVYNAGQFRRQFSSGF